MKVYSFDSHVGESAVLGQPTGVCPCVILTANVLSSHKQLLNLELPHPSVAGTQLTHSLTFSSAECCPWLAKP
jgi:hypothetical protein